jgi:hypothetical protein
MTLIMYPLKARIFVSSGVENRQHPGDLMSGKPKGDSSDSTNPTSQNDAEQTRATLSEHSVDLMLDRKIPSIPKSNDSASSMSNDAATYPIPPDWIRSTFKRDPAKPTAVFLDDFRESTDIKVRGEVGYSHGELSSRIAEANGFNVDRLQIGLVKRGFMDLPGGLKQINDSVDSGKVQLKPGDVVNISLGVDVKFDQVSKMLGIQITPENIREKRDEIFKIARQKLDDKQGTPNERGLMKQMIDCTEQIQKLQERGITVVAAGGNKGPDHLNFALIAANKQYAATTPDGKIAAYSANNSLTESGTGEIHLMSMRTNPFDPTPIENQQGSYRVQGTNAHLPADELGGFLEFTPVQFNNTKLVRQLMSPQTILENGEFEAPDPAAWINGSEATMVQGTSFVNVFKLTEEVKKKKDE